jgi:predicted Zn-dependent protease
LTVTLLRAACAVLAALAAAWFALGIRQAHDTARAQEIMNGMAALDAAQAREVSSLLNDAGQLNPDKTVAILRGQLALERGHEQRALRMLLDVALKEPQNLDAWVWVGRASTHDQRTFLEAVDRVRRLDPRLDNR